MVSFFRAWVSLVLALLVTALVVPAAAQQTESRIVGRVLNQSAGALPGVTINVTSKTTGAARSTVTEADGTYAVTNLGPGPPPGYETPHAPPPPAPQGAPATAQESKPTARRQRPVRAQDVQTLRGRERSTKAKWQNQGWEVVLEDRGTVHAGVNFRRVKPKTPAPTFSVPSPPSDGCSRRRGSS